MKIGLFGGSFNPIHNGHLQIGRTMLEQMSLDEVWYMVSPQNPLKQQMDLLDEGLRLKMVSKALEKDKGLRAMDYEFHLPRPSYTWNTLQSLAKDFPEDEFVLIIGGDNWAHFDRWAHHDEILASYRVAVFPREGAEAAETFLLDKEIKMHAANVSFVKVPLVNVTSTMLREKIKKGEDVSGYVPKEILADAKEYYYKR